MRGSLILQTAARLLLPLLLIFSVAVLLRGHNAPGGGFVGGLIAACGVALHAMAFGPGSARRLVGPDPRTWLAAGLLVALASGLLALAGGGAPFQGLWTTLWTPGLGEIKLGTPVLFDVGVYLVVAAAMIMMVLTLQEE